MEIAEVLMNPVRQRIFQYLLVHRTATVKEIKKALPDIPSASLYRHVKILTDSSVLLIAKENRIRGTVECVYRLNKDALELCDKDGRALQLALLGICTEFAKYFARDDADPKRDLYMLINCTLTLTDEEFAGFLGEVNDVALKYMGKELTPQSKTRQLSLISSPVGE